VLADQVVEARSVAYDVNSASDAGTQDRSMVEEKIYTPEAGSLVYPLPCLLMLTRLIATLVSGILFGGICVVPRSGISPARCGCR